MFYGSFVWILSMSIQRRVSSIIQGGLPSCLFLWWYFYWRVWFREVFSFVWGALFLLFLSSPLSVGIQYSQVHVIFLLFKLSRLFKVHFSYFFFHLRVVSASSIPKYMQFSFSSSFLGCLRYTFLIFFFSSPFSVGIQYSVGHVIFLPFKHNDYFLI